MLGSHGLNIFDDLQEYRVSQHNYAVLNFLIMVTLTAPGMGSTYVELHNLVLLQPKH